MKKPTIERIKAHLEELESFEAHCEENCYADTEQLWNYLLISSDLLSRIVRLLESGQIQGGNHD